MVVQQQQTTSRSFSRPNPCNGHRATRDFYTRYSKSEHTAQLCHNLVTTLSQPRHKVVTLSTRVLDKHIHPAHTFYDIMLQRLSMH